jgi:streptogramin lyase
MVRALSALLLLLAAPALAAQGGYVLQPGDVVIADAPSWWGSSNPSAVRILRPDGSLHTVASSATSPLEFPSDVLIDRDGAILVASYVDQGTQNYVYRIDPRTGLFQTLNQQVLVEPFQMTRDAAGDLVVADGHGGLARIDDQGAVYWFSPPSHPDRSQFGVVLDYDGSFFVTEPPGYASGYAYDGIVWRVDAATGAQTLVCQDLVELPEPKGLALGADGNLLVTDALDYGAQVRHGLVRVDRHSGAVQVLERAGLTTPMDVERYASGRHLMTDKGAEALVAFRPGGGVDRVVSEHDDGDPFNGLPVDRPYGLAVVPWLWLRTPVAVRLGDTVDLRVDTSPRFAGQEVVLATSLRRSPTRMATVWPGDLQTTPLDLAHASLRRAAVPADGRLRFPVSVPRDPALIGRAVQVQAFLESRRLLSNAEALPIRR